MRQEYLAQAFHEILIVQLHRADVDRDIFQFRPFPQAHTDLFNHPFAQRYDELVFLGERDELVGRYQSPFRVFPADQRLGAHDLLILVVLGLEQQSELPLLQGRAHIALQPEAVVHVLLHVRMIEADGVAAPRLGAVHGGIRLFQHHVGVLTVHGIKGDTDTGTDMVHVSIQAVGPVHVLKYSL